ncbi:MAG: cellobiose phosphorylase [Candidatus Omnitrophota bacterium]|jgi:hypothetical protein|nr:MAG: cellobiose phosphorylase [Candidatus Omnitrophota bacterium]
MKKNTARKPKYQLTENGEFVIENYNFSRPFANFFPGIAGKYGIPMWVFYVNRGQCISSFGTKDKDNAILEFFPANKSWQFVSSCGFRTFLKTSKSGKTVFYEPFHNGAANIGFDLSNKMLISSSGLRLEEVNKTLGLHIMIDYFTIPQDSFAGLARIITVRNTTGKKQSLHIADGLPQIIPYGTNNFFLKKLGRTIEAWMRAENTENKAPFYRLTVDPTDRPEVIHIKEGNFCVSFHYENSKTKATLLDTIVDPAVIFNDNTDFSYPAGFLKNDKPEKINNNEVYSKTPSALFTAKIELAGGKEKSFYSVFGYMRSKDILNANISRMTKPGYLEAKKEENQKIINELQDNVNTKSSSREFNLYVKQTYLDNILRGGYPALFKSKKTDSLFYIYSRKHGDLERDYNRFHLHPTYFSQGNGNYRDVNQNRRCDSWLYPGIGEENITTFLNLIQTDGFNPLVVKGSVFCLDSKDGLKSYLQNITESNKTSQILQLLSSNFSPGDIILYLHENNIKLRVSYDEFLANLLSYCTKLQEAEHGEGFWIDHWHYNLDLLENYLGVFPENLEELIFKKRIFTYFDNTEVVKPRSEKYILRNGLCKQLHSIAADTYKKELIRKRGEFPNLARNNYGKGEIHKTTLINKLLCLLVNKTSSLDPFGVGIEMEADKPNWFDSLNGLPALFGSSSCETFEVKRLALFIITVLNKSSVDRLALTQEIWEFISTINGLISAYFQDNSADKDYSYWDMATTAKESYRELTKLGFSGKEVEIERQKILEIIENFLKKINDACLKAKDKKSKLINSYFINEVVNFTPLKDNGFKPIKFTQKPLPLFLEGQMHALRLAENRNDALALIESVKKSGLFDKKLKMYKVTASLESMPEEIGRCRVFNPGWLENESIWLHMEYKYLLEMMKNGFYDEFYRDFKNVFIPFQDPERYGRSVLENSSFIVSSAFPDKRLHGNGFVARLSGSTVELINIWLIMSIGKEPFFLDNNKNLNLRLEPILPGWLFDKNGYYVFNFLSKTNITYYNKNKKDTFGKGGAQVKSIILYSNGKKIVEIRSNIITSPFASQIRSNKIDKIEAFLT